jgi:hypothetical protein
MNLVKISSLLIALLIITLLAACGETITTKKPKANVISGQVQGYTGGGATLEAHLATGDAIVGTGSIKADGSFNFTFVDSVENKDLVVVSKPCEGVMMTPDTFKGNGVRVISVVKNGQTIGMLIQADEIIGTASKIVSRFYVDRDASMTGTCQDNSTFNMTYKKGWNLALGGFGTMASSMSTIESADLPWFYAVEQQPAPQP